MALGFIRKIFSFGKDKVEEVPAAPDETIAEIEETSPPTAPDERDVARPATEPQSDVDSAEESARMPERHGDAPEGSGPAANQVPEPPAPGESPVMPAKPSTGAGSETDLPPPVDEPEPQQGRIPAPAPTGRIKVAREVERIAAPEEVAPAQAAPRASWFERLTKGLSRSSKELSGSIAGILTRRRLDEDTLQELEDVLIRADLGMETAIRITDALASGRYGRDIGDREVRAIMAEEVEKVLKPVALPLELDLSHKPHVILVVGVNGTGKTTTIGKLAAKLRSGGLSVMLAAGDTFRAAAIEQLKIWGERTRSPVVASSLGSDAAGLAYDAFRQARETGADVLIIDTAGRLQNKAELMDELAKIVRVLGKLDPEAPHTVLLTLDATTGQNALNQVEIFRNVAGVNGLVVTKLDGTARGGILVAVAAKYKLPVYFIGVGEQVDDLEPFSASEFAQAITGAAA